MHSQTDFIGIVAETDGNQKTKAPCDFTILLHWWLLVEMKDNVCPTT